MNALRNPILLKQFTVPANGRDLQIHFPLLETAGVFLVPGILTKEICVVIEEANKVSEDRINTTEEVNDVIEEVNKVTGNTGPLLLQVCNRVLFLKSNKTGYRLPRM